MTKDVRVPTFLDAQKCYRAGLSRRGFCASVGSAVSLIYLSSPAFGNSSPADSWDLSDLFKSDAAWDSEADAMPSLTAIWRDHSVDLSDAANFLRTLDDRDAAILRSVRLVLYANFKADEDLRIAANADRATRALGLHSQLTQAMTWVDEAILKLGQPRVEDLIAEEPRLETYRFPLRSLFRRAKHMLDAKGEALMASSEPVLAAPQRTRQLLFSSDIDFPKIELASGPVRLDLDGYGYVMANGSRDERALAYGMFAETLHQYESTLGSVLASEVAGNVFNAKARGFETAVDASLDDAQVPRAIYDQLLRSVRAQLPLQNRYLSVKARMLGIDQLAIHDVAAPSVRLDHRWTISEARALTLKSVAPLGTDYQRQFAENSLKRWADTTPRQGKREGGYVNGSAYSHPYILLNYRDDFPSLSTYAHEWGHAMHSCYARAQPHPLYDFKTFIAEIPSKVHELLLLDHLIETAPSRAERIFFVDRLCEQYRGTLFTQSMFAEFELAIHSAAEAGAPLSGKQMSAQWSTLLAEYYGPGVALHAHSGSFWSTVIHFYLNFYVFQYATCLTAATVLVDAIRREGPSARKRYLEILSKGGSADAFSVIKAAGVDLSTPDPYRRALTRFGEAVSDLESLI